MAEINHQSRNVLPGQRDMHLLVFAPSLRRAGGSLERLKDGGLLRLGTEGLMGVRFEKVQSE